MWLILLQTTGALVNINNQPIVNKLSPRPIFLFIEPRVRVIEYQIWTRSLNFGGVSITFCYANKFDS